MSQSAGKRRLRLRPHLYRQKAPQRNRAFNPSHTRSRRHCRQRRNPRRSADSGTSSWGGRTSRHKPQSRQSRLRLPSRFEGSKSRSNLRQPRQLLRLCRSGSRSALQRSQSPRSPRSPRRRRLRSPRQRPLPKRLRLRKLRLHRNRPRPQRLRRLQSPHPQRTKALIPRRSSVPSLPRPKRRRSKIATCKS
jgi:hypothetical protein